MEFYSPVWYSCVTAKREEVKCCTVNSFQPVHRVSHPDNYLGSKYPETTTLFRYGI